MQATGSLGPLALRSRGLLWAGMVPVVRLGLAIRETSCVETAAESCQTKIKNEYRGERAAAVRSVE